MSVQNLSRKHAVKKTKLMFYNLQFMVNIRVKGHFRNNRIYNTKQVPHLEKLMEHTVTKLL